MVLQPEEAGRATSVDEAGRNRQIRLAAVASVVGTSIEWYDFFLYGTAAAIVFPAVFFPASSSYSGTLDSFATYAVGFAARPVGAAMPIVAVPGRTPTRALARPIISSVMISVALRPSRSPQ